MKSIASWVLLATSLVGTALAPLSAQSTVTTEKEVGTPSTTVETKTYQKDGKTITERVIVTTQRERESVAQTYKVAIFVSNRADHAYDEKIAPLEDYITSRISDLGMSVISRETATNAVASLDRPTTATATVKVSTVTAQENKTSEHNTATVSAQTEAALDQALAQNTSALRLAQSLGADYLLQVSIAGYDKNLRKVDAYGVKLLNEERNLRVVYKILDGNTGASLTSDTLKSSKLVQQTEHAVSSQTDGIDELLDDAAQKVAASLQSRIQRNRIAPPTAARALVKVSLQTEAADLTIPDVRIGVENTVTISESKYKVSALSATVEVDGLAVGTAPGEITVKPGLSKLRITREGFRPYERTVNFTEGQKLTVALALSDEGYARWKDSTKFLNDLKNGAKLTDGEVKVLEGKAKMLEQSGFKVNVNTTEGLGGITVNQGRILQNTAPGKADVVRSIFDF